MHVHIHTNSQGYGIRNFTPKVQELKSKQQHERVAIILCFGNLDVQQQLHIFIQLSDGNVGNGANNMVIHIYTYVNVILVFGVVPPREKVTVSGISIITN